MKKSARTGEELPVDRTTVGVVAHQPPRGLLDRPEHRLDRSLLLHDRSLLHDDRRAVDGPVDRLLIDGLDPSGLDTLPR